jgi:CheY-like chemotaxis protein
MSAQIWQNNHRLEGQLLLLEDHQELAASLEEFLELYSCRTVRVTNGADGLRKILLTDFDYILCDMVMPGFPGDMFYYAVERVKPALCRRFVFMSGEKGDPQWETFVARIDGVMLWKPFHMHELLKALQAVSGKPLQRRPHSIAVPPPALGMPLVRRA